ncbi:uncharacterized protein LOC127880713 [Dreissena polymorpha]|uniref:Tyrosine specific protein phosphatases domain-containing protein n=1 Tax=Dreissena polymorpha TaxID=45954 RepID=A0A9D4GT24_DREPO|nr:uncharacterized protein LOC127880713 [Dreissena polymorpha]KAH3821010.1 hypothetical protein DPMN_122765 [Dreissena polymorpha]
MEFQNVCTWLVAIIATSASSVTVQVDTAVKRQPPGLKSPMKVWWAKELTPDFHIAGRLTERQIKYASEAGFRSILSLFMYETNDGGNFGGEYLPTTAEAWATAHMAGLQYVALIGGNDDWTSIDTIQRFHDVLPALRKPILLHCDRGYTITFVTLMHMANQTRHNSSFEPKIYSHNFYKITGAMGLDFTHDDMKEVVANVTGEPVVEKPPKHNCEPEEWRDFWLAHPISKNWYMGGQVRKCDVKILEQTGFKAIINMRLGVTHNGQPSQEPTALLNVKDEPTTYGNSTTPPRQDLKTLETNKINEHHSSDYISKKSRINYETENPLEFGDDIGYNEDAEEEVVMKTSLKYYHIPIPPNSTFTASMFSQIRDTLIQAGQLGPVMLHCSDGRRVAYFGVLAAAIHEGHDLNWALKRVQELGFEVSPDVQPDVYKMYCESFEQSHSFKNEEL